MERGAKTIKVRVLRSQRGGGGAHYDTYEVPFEEKMSVFNVLERIGNEIDTSLAFYASCRIGKCMGCIMKINGKQGFACTTLVKGDLTLEPDPRFPVIRDLVVDYEAKK
jgi:succinate dehydrogenase/fumarate reductase-like Fe-S protein